MTLSQVQKMEKITLSQVQEVLKLVSYIYIQHLADDKWELLLDNNKMPFKYLSDAIRYVRNNPQMFYYVKLSSYQQAMMDNGEWDNF